MEQVRPLTSLSHDELIARIEQYVEVLRIKEAEIVELHAAVDALKTLLSEARTTIDRQAATIRQYEREMEAIGAGGVSLMGGA